MTGSFTVQMRTDVQKCQFCRERPGEYVLNLIPICAICGADQMANGHGKLERNFTTGSLYSHEYKSDPGPIVESVDSTEDEDDQEEAAEPIQRLDVKGFYCPNCEYDHIGYEFTVTTMYRLDEENYFDDAGEDHVYKSLDHEEIQVVECEETFYVVDENDPNHRIPTYALEVWACGNCGDYFLDRAAAVACCN